VPVVTRSKAISFSGIPDLGSDPLLFEKIGTLFDLVRPIGFKRIYIFLLYLNL
jgi:hypothetical protein